MSEWNDLKTKITETLKLFREIARVQARQALERLAKGKKRGRSRRGPRRLLAGGLALLLCGVFFAFRFFESGGAVTWRFSEKGDFILRLALGKKIPVPGFQPDGVFVLSDFEKMGDFKAWTLVSASLRPSSDHASGGKFSGEALFLAETENFGSLVLDDLAKSTRGVSDWNNFQSVEFAISNPQDRAQDLLMLVTDVTGKIFTEKLLVPPGGPHNFSIPLDKIAQAVNIRRVNQVAFCSYTKTPLTFYFDDIRLIPISGGKAALGRFFYGGSSTRPVRPFDYNFTARKPLWLFKDPQVPGPVVRVPFVVKNETAAPCHQWPVEGTVPFPRGELKLQSNLRILNDQGESLVFDSRVLARWPDNSIRWLALSFDATLKPGEGKGFFLDYGPEIKVIDFDPGIRIEEDRNRIKIETGGLQVLLNKKTFYLFDEVRLQYPETKTFDHGTQMVSKAQLTLGFRGETFRTDLARDGYEITVEEAGKRRAVVKAQGWYVSPKKDRFCKALVRYYFYAEKNYVKVSHTLIYTGYPENPFFTGYRDLNLPSNETVESLGMVVPCAFAGPEGVTVSSASAQAGIMAVDPASSPRFAQTGWEEVLFTKIGAADVKARDALAGWLDVSGEKSGVMIALRNFRENFPKALGIDSSASRINVDLWPREAGELNLATAKSAVARDDAARGSAFGLAKTHELLFDFHAGDLNTSLAANRAHAFARPLMLRSNPYWADATGALGRLFPVDPLYSEPEKLLENLFDWAARQPMLAGWYGMLDFGDTLTWYRNADDLGRYAAWGWYPSGQWGWYNCTGVGLHTGALLQFVRSGNWKYFEFGRHAARHIMDVDTVHYDTVAADPRLRPLQALAFSRIGSMHRHNANHWGGRNDQASETNVLGLVLYYCLTGDERALDVIAEVGEFFLSEPFTYAGHPDVAPQAALANTLWGDVLLFELTGDPRFKRGADKIADFFISGQQADGSFLEYFNPVERKWGGQKVPLYMAWYTAGALKSYHELTQDLQVKDVFLKLVRFLAPDPVMGPSILDGIAYAWQVSHDDFFIRAADGNLRRLLAGVKASSDPAFGGLIFDKAIYHQPMVFLSTVPYVFGALEEKIEKKKQP